MIATGVMSMQSTLAITIVVFPDVLCRDPNDVTARCIIIICISHACQMYYYYARYIISIMLICYVMICYVNMYNDMLCYVMLCYVNMLC